MNLEEIISKHNYYHNDKKYNCAKTLLAILGEKENIEISEQVYAAATCMNGLGRSGAQCGLVEGAAMFIGIYYSHKGLEAFKIYPICQEFAQNFTTDFSSFLCSELMPNGFNNVDDKNLCRYLMLKAITFTTDFIAL